MQWDLGLQGLALLGAMSVGFGVFGGLVVGGDPRRRLWTSAATTVACFAVGLLTSEVIFGWATDEELQPNIDGLSRDEVLLSCVLTTALVLLAVHYLVPRTGSNRSGDQQLGRRPTHHA
jgi:hypothetical protein